MSVQFDTIPADILLPLVYMEFSGKAPTAPGALVKPTVLLGQKIGAGTATAGVINSVSSKTEGVTLFGRGSQLARMCAAFFDAFPGGELFAIALADDSGGTAGSVTLTVTGTSTESGTIFLRVGNDLVEVAIASGTVQNDIAAAIDAACDLALDLPVTVGASSNVATLTNRHKGTLGNQVPVTINALGQIGGEALPAGVSIAISSTYPTNGATDPTAASWVTAMADTAFDVIAPGLSTSAVLTALKTETTRRWDPTLGIGGHVVAVVMDSHSDLLTLGPMRNDKHATIFGIPESATVTWRTPQYELVALLAGLFARYLGTDPARPLQHLTLPGAHGGSEFTWTQRQAQAKAGIATLSVLNGEVTINAEVSSYTVGAGALTDLAWQYPQIAFVLQRWKRRMDNRMTRFSSFKLADDGQPIKPGQRVLTPKTAKGEFVAEYSDMVDESLMEGLATFKATLVVERNALNRNRLDVLARPNPINQFRQLAVRNEFEV